MSYIKIINEETNACEVFLNESPTEEQIAGLTDQGYVEGEWERGYDGIPYEKGYAPEKPESEKQSEVRLIRNQYLADTDKYMISDFPVSKDEKSKYKTYRQYLRDYTEQEDWWENQPLDFEAWKDEQ